MAGDLPTFANERDFFGKADFNERVVRVNRFPPCDVPECTDKFKCQRYCLGELDSRKCPSTYNTARRT